MNEPAIVHIDSTSCALLHGVSDDELFDGVLDATRIESFVGSEERALFVAVVDDRVVAQCTVFVLRHLDRAADLYVDELGTHPDHQRRGVARRLLQAAAAWGVGRGCETLWVAADADNDPALALYDAVGGTRKPAVVFDLSLLERPDA